MVEKFFYDTKAGRWLMLLGIGFFAMPTHVESDPRIAKFANYVIPPIAAAWLFAPAFATFGEAILTAAAVGETMSKQGYHHFLKEVYTCNYIVSFVISLILIYAISTIRWIDHRLWVLIFRAFDLPTRAIVLRYFILTTSYPALIMAVLFFVVAMLLPAFVQQNGAPIFNFMGEHPGLTLGAMAAVGLLGNLKERVDVLRDRQMYGSPWAGVVKRMVTTAALLGAMYALPRLLL
ncbi:hypothetical protein [Shumkonia mesophila]|uniref:hypothetical protein n=1 Tax=Shumkonia mesophila TaxID=2838854 RepID=UPI002934C1FB|nr:hypothetical protein [Shumkonia mesophila]